MDAVVVVVGHHDAAVKGRDCDAIRVVEFVVAVARLAEREIERAVGVEDLDAVVVAVGHDKAVRVVKGDACQVATKLPIVYARVVPRYEGCPVDVSHGEAESGRCDPCRGASRHGVAGARVPVSDDMRVGAVRPEHAEVGVATANDKAAAGVNGYLIRGDWALTVVSDELEVERAVGVEDLDAVVAAVGHRNAAVKCNGDAVRAAKLAVAVAATGAVAVNPANLEVERAVGVEDLDAVVAAVGHRNAAVKGRDSHGGRVMELAVAVARLAERDDMRYMEAGCDAEDQATACRQGSRRAGRRQCKIGVAAGCAHYRAPSVREGRRSRVVESVVSVVVPHDVREH